MAVVVLKHLICVVSRLDGYNGQIANDSSALLRDLGVQLLVKVIDWLILL